MIRTLCLGATLLCLSSAQARPPGDDERTYIVGGEPAEESGSVVAVFRDGTFGCTGTLIHPRFVLTAAHCSAGITHVTVGALDWTSEGEPIEIVSITGYEKYWTSYDIAILELAREASVSPQALLLDCLIDNYLDDGSPARIAGFGATDENGIELGSVLMSAEVDILDADCQDPIYGCIEEVAPGGELVAGGEGVDTCVGDSGGPIFIQTELGERLVGVTSRGIDQATVTCGDGGIYVRPDAVIDWIESVIGEPLEHPDCEALNDAPNPSDYSLVASGMLGGSVHIDPNDPDLDDEHTYTLAEPPKNGRVALSPSGTVAYWPDHSMITTDEFTVLVADDGTPPLSRSSTIHVEVLSVQGEPNSCGCRTTPGIHLAFWLLLIPCFRRTQKR